MKREDSRGEEMPLHLHGSGFRGAGQVRLLSCGAHVSVAKISFFRENLSRNTISLMRRNTTNHRVKTGVYKFQLLRAHLDLDHNYIIII
jgi:hypothetical protein